VNPRDLIALLGGTPGGDLGRRRKNMTKTVIAANDHGADTDQLDHFAEISTRSHRATRGNATTVSSGLALVATWHCAASLS
jgi:hypothetical protein